MKVFHCNRLTGLLYSLMLTAATFSNAVTAEDPPPKQESIYSGPATSKNFCMADAYLNAGGSGLKDVKGEMLNCTANDVEITAVKPVAIVLPDGSTTDDLTCTLGKTFTLIADVTVRTNAAERWDTTFYVPLKEQHPDVVTKDSEACSILLPVPQGTSGYDPDFLKAQQLDGDACGDIQKMALINDEYVLPMARFDILCADADPDGDGPLEPDGRADFNYCAAWDNISRKNCSADVGQVPNNKSKCKCDTFDIDVFVQPNPPLATKTVTPLQNYEPSGTFTYTVKFEKQTGADVNITAIKDVYYSSTDTSISGVFDLNAAPKNVDTPVAGGILNFLDAMGENTCNNVTLPITLTTSSPTYECYFQVRIDDEDLPNDPAPNSTAPDELYLDFIRFSATDSEGRNVPVGDDTCDPSAMPPTTGNCSAIKTVKMQNKDPVIEITKKPVKGPGLKQINGAYFVDNQGDITYEITVTNKSPVDAISLLGLKDDNGTPATTDDAMDPDLADDIDLLNDESVTNTMAIKNCKTAAAGSFAKNASFTCQFKVNVTLADGDSHTNTVRVTGQDNEARKASDTANATITRATPMLTLTKDVAESVDPAIPTPLLDAAAFMDEITVDEPGATVVYRFTINNTSDDTQESLTLTELVDDTLFSSARASKAATQRPDECDFTTVVAYGTPYVCTLVADVIGKTPPEPNALVNTAYVKAQAASGLEVKSNEDTATVKFKDVPPDIDATFGLSARLYLSIQNKSDFEDVTLKHLKIHGIELPDTNMTASDGDLRIINDGASAFAYGDTYEYCELEKVIAYGTTYSCQIRLEFKDAISFATYTALTNSGGGVEVIVEDDDGSTDDAKADITFTLVAPTPIP